MKSFKILSKIILSQNKPHYTLYLQIVQQKQQNKRDKTANHSGSEYFWSMSF